MSRDGGWFVTASRHHVQVWRVMETVAKANELITAKDDVWCLALSRDGTRVVIGCADGCILVWNHLTNITERWMHGHDFCSVGCVAFSYDGRHVVSGSSDGSVRIWDCHTGNEVSMYQTSHCVTRCVAFSRDSGRVAIGFETYGSDSEGTVRIWNPSNGQIQIRPETGWMDSVAFSHDDSYVMFGSSRGVLIWNLTTNESTHLVGSGRLPDGTRVHSLGIGCFHIYDPVDQEATNDTYPYLLSISDNRDWILGGQAEHDCWISPHYRNFTWAYVAKSRVWLVYRSKSMIVLDLKSTQRV